MHDGHYVAFMGHGFRPIKSYRNSDSNWTLAQADDATTYLLHSGGKGTLIEWSPLVWLGWPGSGLDDLSVE